jgi:hypothetical protein
LSLFTCTSFVVVVVVVAHGVRLVRLKATHHRHRQFKIQLRPMIQRASLAGCAGDWAWGTALGASTHKLGGRWGTHYRLCSCPSWQGLTARPGLSLQELLESGRRDAP